MTIQSAMGAVLEIGGTGDLGEEAGWQTIGQITDFGEIGPTDELITVESFGVNHVQKLKGLTNFGSMQLSLAQDLDDDGQDALRDARDDRENAYNFRVKYPLKDGEDEPVMDEFKAMVMSFVTNVGTPNSVIGATATLEVTSEINRVDAVPEA